MQIVFIHGWSDSEDNIKPLAKLIAAKLSKTYTFISFSKYVSLNDEITFDDLAYGMMKAWQAAGLSLQPKSVDVVAHSMGALVLRCWLNRYFSIKNQPVRRCVMLGPANFGSVLAHKGQALLSRLFKGCQYKHLFEVGTKLLDGLELGSDWLWQMALQDCIHTSWFNNSNILTTILIGDQGNSGIASLLNEPASDGVIRWGGANLSADYYKLDFTSGKLIVTIKHSKNKIAFRLIKGCNHQTILHAGFKVSEQVFASVFQGLTIKTDDFNRWSDSCDLETKKVLSEHGKIQSSQYFVRLNNQYKQAIDDYCMFGCESDLDDHVLTDHFQFKVQKDVHVYSKLKNHRCFYWGIDEFWQHAAQWQKLHLNFVAYPQIRSGKKEVGYPEVSALEQSWSLVNDDLKYLMLGQKTYFLDVVLPKLQRDIFEIRNC